VNSTRLRSTAASLWAAGTVAAATEPLSDGLFSLSTEARFMNHRPRGFGTTRLLPLSVRRDVLTDQRYLSAGTLTAGPLALLYKMRFNSFSTNFVTRQVSYLSRSSNVVTFSPLHVFYSSGTARRETILYARSSLHTGRVALDKIVHFRRSYCFLHPVIVFAFWT